MIKSFKSQLTLLTLLISPLILLAQYGDVGGMSGTRMGDYLSYYGGSTGSASKLKSPEHYLYSGWENSGSVYVGKTVYRINNINYDIKMGQFMTKTDKDSLFIYDKNSIDSIAINGKKFKKYYDPTSSSDRIVFGEVIFDSNNIHIIKGYYLSEVESSPNPMINRPNDVIKQRTRYYTANGNTLESFNLNKRNVLQLLDNPELEDEAKDFAKQNHLSFNSDQDVMTILKHTLNQVE